MDERGVNMVVSIARQAVIIKCNIQKSVMLGNYEFYYGAGLLAKISGRSIEKGMEANALMEQVQTIIADYEPKDEKEEHLIHMLRYFHPDERHDEQMDQLFQMGVEEEQIWVE